MAYPYPNTVEGKKAEIANYERILSEYNGRWYDMGRRHLADLKQELAELAQQEKLEGKSVRD